MDTDPDSLLGWLTEEDPDRLDLLWHMADSTRRETVGDAVHLRGLVEISNVCVRQCAYCGLRAGNVGRERYRMTVNEILGCAHEAVSLGYGTVVLQSGEDYGLSRAWVGSVVRRIKEQTPLAVTLSLGERTEDDLHAWRKAGADRYFLRFETSDTTLYGRIHPSLPSRPSDRLAILRALREIGYETGSGVMIGIPGQSYPSLAEDLLTFQSLDLDMIGVGPYLPHPVTPMGCGIWENGLPVPEQVPNSELMVYKVIALTRLCCPEANIPSTTALATLNPEKGYELGLMRGANVVMPNITPHPYRARYEIYPNKMRSIPTSHSIGGLPERIRSIGRVVGKGPGKRVRGSERSRQHLQEVPKIGRNEAPKALSGSTSAEIAHIGSYKKHQRSSAKTFTRGGPYDSTNPTFHLPLSESRLPTSDF